MHNIADWKTQIIVGFTLILILSMFPANTPSTRGNNNPQAIKPQSPSTSQSSPPQQADKLTPIISEHRITPSELTKLQQKTPTWQEAENYNQKVNGHGTGLAPPNPNDWSTIADTALITTQITLPLVTSTPSGIDHSADPWFPPIGNQDGKGSCVAWAVAYYIKSYQEAKEHNWNLSEATWDGGYYGHPNTNYQTKIFSPDFVYNLINYGIDGGSSYYDAINLICSIGAATWATMPYNPSDPTSWPSEAAWREAPSYRGNASGYRQMFIDTDEDLQSLKNWIALGNLAIISIDANKYSGLTSQDFWTLDNYANPSENHANTVVGYDDNISYTEAGQSRNGAFKIANSWGIGGWEKTSDGFYWVSYEAMKQRVGQFMYYFDLINYQPSLTASFKISHAKRGECGITIGLGDSSHPLITKRFDAYINGGSFPFCSNVIAFDITEFASATPALIGQTFYLRVYDSGNATTGIIEKFAINETESNDPPLDTLNAGYVFARLTLNSVATIRVLPPEITLSTGYVVGENLTVAIVIESASNLYGFSLEFRWNSTFLKPVDHVITIPAENYPSPIGPSPYGGVLDAPAIMNYEDFNELDGVIRIDCESISPAQSFEGNGTILAVTFSIENQYDSEVEVPLILTNCSLHDSYDGLLPFENANGIVKIPGLPPDITCPVIVVLSPENRSYADADVPVVFNVNELSSWCGYSLDGHQNITAFINFTLLGLSEGHHDIVIFANDTHGNMGTSENVSFAVDTTPPDVVIISPENATYDKDQIALFFRLSDETSWIGYSLDEGTNQTIAGNTTIIALGDGEHRLRMFATDSCGNIGVSNDVLFGVDTTCPSVSDVSHPTSIVLPETEVQITARATDAFSGIYHVFLNVTYRNYTNCWTNVTDMNNLGGDLWQGGIPTVPPGTNVTYCVISDDAVGNRAISESYEYECPDPFVPEFGSLSAVILMTLALGSALMIKRIKKKSCLDPVTPNPSVFLLPMSTVTFFFCF